MLIDLLLEKVENVDSSGGKLGTNQNRLESYGSGSEAHAFYQNVPLILFFLFLFLFYEQFYSSLLPAIQTNDRI